MIATWKVPVKHFNGKNSNDPNQVNLEPLGGEDDRRMFEAPRLAHCAAEAEKADSHAFRESVCLSLQALSKRISFTRAFLFPS